jgi:hypothetical protein
MISLASSRSSASGVGAENGVRGFVVLPKRWIVERSIAWQSLSPARQGLGEPQWKSTRVLASRINSTHAQKTLQSGLKSLDRLF